MTHHGEGGRRRPRRLRAIPLLPSLFTLGNLICGFAAIHFALRAMYEFGAAAPGTPPATLHGPLRSLELMMPSFISVGAGLVVLGMVLDLFDGLIARMTRSSTTFGGQLDSLADVVTHGVAPATLVIAVLTQYLGRDAIMPSPISEHFLGRVAWIAAAVYVAFAAVRLARFQVEHAEADFDIDVFRGLPSPGAAAVIVSLILLHDQMPAVQGATVYALPAAAFITGCLMVSRIPYTRMSVYLRGRKPIERVILVVIVLAVFWTYKAPTMVMAATLYAVSGPVNLLVRRIRAQGAAAKDAKALDSQQADRERRHA